MDGEQIPKSHFATTTWVGRNDHIDEFDVIVNEHRKVDGFNHGNS